MCLMEILGKSHLNEREVVTYVLYINFMLNLLNNTTYFKTYQIHNVRASTASNKKAKQRIKEQQRNTKINQEIAQNQMSINKQTNKRKSLKPIGHLRTGVSMLSWRDYVLITNS